MVPSEPLRLVREQAERGRMRLREAEPGEADELVEDEVRRLLVDVVPGGAFDEAVAVRLERVVAPLAAHRPAQALGLPTVKPASVIATSSTWSWKTTTPKVPCSGSRRSSWSTGQT